MRDYKNIFFSMSKASIERDIKSLVTKSSSLLFIVEIEAKQLLNNYFNLLETFHKNQEQKKLFIRKQNDFFFYFKANTISCWYFR